MKKLEGSRRLDLTKVVILTILTIGVYGIYLFYNNLKILKEYDKKPYSKAFIILYIFPVVKLIFLYLIMVKTTKLIKLKKKNQLRLINAMMLVYVLEYSIGRIGDSIPYGIYMILLILISIIYLITITNYQKHMNKFLEKHEKGRVYKKIYTSEIIFTLIYWMILLFFLGVFLISFMI